MWTLFECTAASIIVFTLVDVLDRRSTGFDARCMLLLVSRICASRINCNCKLKRSNSRQLWLRSDPDIQILDLTQFPSIANCG